MSNLIMRSITLKNIDIMLPLYKTLIRPIIEYGNCVWYPYKRKDIDMIKSVQRNFTKCIKGLKNYEYEERLRALNIPSLEYRRIRGDLIETFKMFNNQYDPLATKPIINLSPV